MGDRESASLQKDRTPLGSGIVHLWLRTGGGRPAIYQFRSDWNEMPNWRVSLVGGDDASI